MTTLYHLIGSETELGRVGEALREFVQQLGVPVVAACHVTCADETERECGEAFQRWFAGQLLPELKPRRRAPLRITNLGARYEWGAVRVAEEHYATPAAHAASKLLVVKINAHVAVRPSPDGPEYGWLDRYGVRSACCGALAGLFQGTLLPGIEQLREIFRVEGTDRLAALADPELVEPRHRALLTAVVSARLQAARAVLDIQEHRPATPTVFLVLPCVTINRAETDTELVVGQFGVDRTERTPEVKYRGLGEEPDEYRIRHEAGRVIIEDEDWPGGE